MIILGIGYRSTFGYILIVQAFVIVIIKKTVYIFCAAELESVRIQVNESAVNAGETKIKICTLLYKCIKAI